ncbi:MAG: nucleotidyltransferase family protein, partial [Candidatus Promineifilaceae bacterium]
MATPGPAQAAEGALLAGLRAVLAGRTLVRPAFAAAPADLLRLAAAQNLIPWLEVAYRPGELPTSIAADVQRECLRRRARQALLLGAFEELEQTLGAAGVRAMPFKGLAMAHRHYASPTLRYFDDLDILIPAASADAALAVLAEAGYAPHPRNPRPDWHHLPPQVHRGHHAMVELHLDPARRFKPGWDVAGVWSRASRARLGAVETWLMSDADALVTVALHARHNLFDRLTYFLDAAVLLTALRKRPKELARARELAAEAGVAAALDHLLARTHALFP